MFTDSPTGMAWGAVFTLLLSAGCYTDVRTRKIPNALVAAILAGGLLYSMIARGVTGLGSSAAGAALGFAIWIAFYAAGAIGAGDVKFFAAAGAWLGPGATWRAALIAAVVGGMLALGVLLRERRLGATIRRLVLAASSGSLTLVREQGGGPPTDRRPLPYGVALAVGALVMAWIPTRP